MGSSLAFSCSSIGRTNPTQKLKFEGSVGIGPYVLLRLWTTHGATPWRSWERKSLQVVISSALVRDAGEEVAVIGGEEGEECVGDDDDDEWEDDDEGEGGSPDETDGEMGLPDVNSASLKSSG
jgi:hypothetical protein